MARYYIIEHGDQREARVLSEYWRRDLAQREFRAAMEVRERAGWKLEMMSADVWLCFKPAKRGTWDADASVLRLITSHEWEKEWLPLMAEAVPC